MRTTSYPCGIFRTCFRPHLVNLAAIVLAKERARKLFGLVAVFIPLLQILFGERRLAHSNMAGNPCDVGVAEYRPNCLAAVGALGAVDDREHLIVQASGNSIHSGDALEFQTSQEPVVLVVVGFRLLPPLVDDGVVVHVPAVVGEA